MINLKHNYRVELAPTLSGHWYNVFEDDVLQGVYPSSTTILNAYPQSPQLTQWIAEKGWQESQRIKSEAGRAGTKVHDAIEDLLNGMLLTKENYSLEEWFKINSFVEWHKVYKPEILAIELPVFSKEYGYAGRSDLIARMNGQIYVLDWKTSRSMHKNFYLQFASYAQAIEEMTDLKVDCVAGLQLGASNKNTYRFAIEPDWRPLVEVFLSVKKTWEYDYGARSEEPPVLILPEQLQL